MPNPESWLRGTVGDERASLAPTDDETSSALSTVLFRYKFRNRLARGITSGITSIFRNIRPQRSFRGPTRRMVPPPLSEEEQRYRRVGTRSMPHVDLSRQQSRASLVVDKGKQPARSQAYRNKSSVDIRTSHHTKSLDWASEYSGGFNAPNISGSGAKPRRGSAPGHARSNLESLRVPVQSASRLPSPQRSPLSQTPSTLNLDEADERPRSRLSLLMRWVLSKPASAGPSQQGSTSTLPSGATSPDSTSPASRSFTTRDLLQRRSDDAFHRVGSRLSREAGSLTQAMRAASWGEVGGYNRPSEDITSLYSDHGEDGPDEDTYLVGFGGVAQSPVSTVPSAVLSTVSSMGSLAPAVPMSAAQILLQRVEAIPVEPLSAPDLAPLQRQAQHRSQATSPLSLHASDDEDDHPQTFDDTGGSDDSGERTPSELDFADVQPSTSRMYQDEDEDSEDEEGQPLEVRTRRPSWSVNSRPSSPRRSDLAHAEGSARPTIRI